MIEKERGSLEEISIIVVRFPAKQNERRTSKTTSTADGLFH